MKHFLLSILLLLAVATASAKSHLNDSIPFLYRGHLYLDAKINNSILSKVIFDTGGADMFGIDSVFLAHSAWKPQKTGRAMAGGAAGKTKVRVIFEPTTVKTGNHTEKFEYVPIFKLRDVVSCHVDGILGIKDIMNRSDDEGMQTFDQHLFQLYKDDVISYDEAIMNANSANNLRLEIKLYEEGLDSGQRGRRIEKMDLM